MIYRKPTWGKWGLSLLTPECHEHDLVASYLDRHPDVAQHYSPTQTVKGYRYFNILDMAEREAKE